MRIHYSLLIKTTDDSTAMVSDLVVDAKPYALVLNSDRTLLLPLANALGEISNLKINPATKKVSKPIKKSSEIKFSSEKNSRTELCKSLDTKKKIVFYPL